MTDYGSPESPLDRRRAGLLLHPTSLPTGPGNGDIGPDAYRFVDFLAAGGFSVWQTLPLGPTHADWSPYQCQSVHAGSERLISLEQLIEHGWLAEDEGPSAEEPAWAYRRRRLAEATDGFRRRGTSEQWHAYREFVASHDYWLEDYVLYQALREAYRGKPWPTWPSALRDREPEALEQARGRLDERLEHFRFEQFFFFRQWGELRRYANERGVLIFGDMPLYVALDSADVWAQREYFRLDDQGRPVAVAGVPPDYFSDTGQRWGNPLYRWRRMKADGFIWWLERMRTQLETFDLIRIDHFRGLEAFWEIPASEETAVNGRWVPAPGHKLLQALRNTFDCLPLVAEDLGVITPEVEALRDAFGLPAMKVLQFAFDGGSANPYLPHHHVPNAVVYTGTHDNNTSLGWFRSLARPQQQYVQDYLGCSRDAMPSALCRAALASVARLAVIPMQDVLRMSADHRMNEPGTNNQLNWRWRFSWEQVDAGLSEQYRHMNALYGRLT